MSVTAIVERVREAFQAGDRMVFFVGAGISAPPPSRVCDFRELNARIISTLARGSLPERERKDLGQVRPEIMLQIGREELGEGVMQALETLEGHQPNFNHFLLAEALIRGNWVFTTNVESLIEDAYKMMTGSKLANRCYSDEHFKAFARSMSDPPDVWPGGYMFKPHGTIEGTRGKERFDSITVALNQIGRGLSEPKVEVLEGFLKNYDFCFMGYSCRDDFSVFPVLMGTKTAKIAIWMQHDVKQRDMCLKQRAEVDNETEALIAKKRAGRVQDGDWEIINSNQVLLKRSRFLKGVGDVSEFLKNEFHPLVRTSASAVARTAKRPSRFPQWARALDDFRLNMFFGHLFDHLGQWDKAEEHWRKSMNDASRTGSDESFVKAKSMVADLYARQTQVDKEMKSIEMYKECIAFVNSHLGSEASTTATLLGFDIANVERRLGTYPASPKEWTERMIRDLARVQREDLGRYASCLNVIALGHIRGDERDLRVGLRFARRCRNLKRRIGDKEGEALAHNTIALLLLAWGRQLAKQDQTQARRVFKRALRHLGIAFDIRIRYGFFRGCAQNYRNMGDANRELMKIANTSRAKHHHLKTGEARYETAIGYLDAVNPVPPPGELVNWRQGIAGLHREFLGLTDDPDRQRRSILKIISIYAEQLNLPNDRTNLREINSKNKELKTARGILEETRRVSDTLGLRSEVRRVDRLLQVIGRP